MAELSPAAQAVREAAKEAWGRQDYPVHTVIAALRALADQVVPHMEEPDFGACNEMRCDIELYTDHQRKRDEILAIAAELEGTS